MGLRLTYFGGQEWRQWTSADRLISRSWSGWDKQRLKHYERLLKSLPQQLQRGAWEREYSILPESSSSCSHRFRWKLCCSQPYPHPDNGIRVYDQSTISNAPPNAPPKPSSQCCHIWLRPVHQLRDHQPAKRRRATSECWSRGRAKSQC
jgi:hypothetical protein